jgi:hypothetical protein
MRFPIGAGIMGGEKNRLNAVTNAAQRTMD